MTAAQAKRLAKQIFDKFDKQIYEATLGTIVPPSFVAGLVGNEAGKDRSGNIVRSATRFEPHVYRHLISVRDGLKASYNKIRRTDLADASDAAIRALSHSYEATQIMGWHVIKNLHCTIADLRNPDKHFFYTVKLLLLNEDGDISTGTDAGFARAMREWNTGKEGGKTYHADYVANAAMVREAYEDLEKTRRHRTLESRIDVPIEVIESEWAAAQDADPAETPAEDDAIESAFEKLTVPPSDRSVHPEPPPETPGSSEVTAKKETATATGTESVEVTQKNEQDVNLPARVSGGAAYNGVGFVETMKGDLKAIGIGNFSFQGLDAYAQNVTGLPPWAVAIITKAALIVGIISICWILFRLVHYAMDRWQNNERVKTEAASKTAIDRKDISWV